MLQHSTRWHHGSELLIELRCVERADHSGYPRGRQRTVGEVDPVEGLKEGVVLELLRIGFAGTQPRLRISP